MEVRLGDARHARDGVRCSRAVAAGRYGYPSQRSMKDHDGHMKGVMGTVTELQVCIERFERQFVLCFVVEIGSPPSQSKNFTTQPIACACHAPRSSNYPVFLF